MINKNRNKNDLKKSIENNANAHVDKGDAYFAKGDLDHAMAEYHEAIRLESNNVNAYVNRGTIYNFKGSFHRAIMEFDKAIDLNVDSDAYAGRGIAYYCKGEYGHAITDLDNAIKLDSSNTWVYGVKGAAYFFKDDYDHAIANLNKAIEIEPNNARAYVTRGITYHKKDDYNSSFIDFDKAIKIDPDLKWKIAYVYIWFHFKEITDASLHIKSFKYCSNLLEITKKLRTNILKRDSVAHYTSLDVLEKLLSGKQFRFYNATYMNDPEEGETFFSILRKEGSIDIKEKFYENSMNFYSPAYIGSFTKVDDSEEEDKLFLWRTYGKHRNQDASGACLIFDPSCFPENIDPGLNSTQKQKGYSDQKTLTTPYLYKVVYQKSMSDDIRDYMKELITQLKSINTECLGKGSGNEEKDLIRGIVRELLDEIRFLFKGDHYSEENEMRVVSISHIPVGGDLSNSGIKEDTSYCPPRLYLDAPEGFHFDKVLLGPQATGLVEWQQWAPLKPQGRGIPIEKSKIPYRSS